MAKKSAQGGDPILEISFFSSGFYTHRSQLFAPYKPIGINVVSFRDPVIDGNNMEDLDTLQWQRRPGFSIFCPTPLPDNEIVNQFYSSRLLTGTVLAFADTNQRLLTFTSLGLNTIIHKTTAAQGYVATLGNVTYFADGAAADLSKWDGARLSAWGLAAPTATPNVFSTALGFWQPDRTFPLNTSLQDTNGNLESVSSILIPNGAVKSPTAASNLALGGSLAISWGAESVHGGYAAVDGYAHIQQVGAYGTAPSLAAALPNNATSGNVIMVQFGNFLTNIDPRNAPYAVSVTDSQGNTYTQQAQFTHVYAPNNTYYFSEWVFTATVGSTAPLTVTVHTSSGDIEMTVHEFQGISATLTTFADNGTENQSTFNSGTAVFAGTKLVMSTIRDTTIGGVSAYPAGYIQGVQAGPISSRQVVYDAYLGATSPQAPVWSLASNGNDLVGITSVWPISSFAPGYTPYLFLQSFNFGLPAGAVVTGIAVAVPKFNSSGSGSVQDQSVKLIIGGAVVGSEHASATIWDNGGYVVTQYGGPTDTWGLTGGQLSTPSNFNTNGTSGFGLAISALVNTIPNGTVIPNVGFTAPNQPTITIYFQQSGGLSGPGITGNIEPIWPVLLGGTVNDGGVTWTNYGPVQAWLPTTYFPTPIVILDNNGNLQLSTHTANPIAAWNSATTYTTGQIVYFGGAYWIAVNATGTNMNIPPSGSYETTGASTNVPYWALTPSPLVTGLNLPVWNTTVGGKTTDGSYTWTNLGQGTPLAVFGYSYVYGYRTIYGHLTTSSPFSINTGAIFGPVNGTITSLAITSNVATFTGDNNFLPGNVFQVQGLTSTTGTQLNFQAMTVISATPSANFPITNNANSVQVTGANILIVQAVNNLVAGQQVTFSGVQTATFLNGVTVTVLAAGLSSTQFEANFTHAAYGPASDNGNVHLIGTYTASTTLGNTSGIVLDQGSAIPLIATVTGVGTGSPLSNSVATITGISITADIVTVNASNNFQPGLWVTFAGLTSAPILNGQQLQVIAVDQPVGTQNTQFQVFFQTANRSQQTETGTATFNAVEIYRTSDGGGLYLFDGAVTNPGLNLPWTFNDFTKDENLDELSIAPLGHQNDPPPGAPGSLVIQQGTVIRYWQGRLWMVVGNFVYFDAGPDCKNGVPEEAWPPGNRFQFAGPVQNIMPTPDGTAMLVYLSDRVNVILGGPETINFYATDFLNNFGISNPNAVYKDGSIIGQFTTQKQYMDLVGREKDDIGEHIGDYLTTNFTAAKTYATLYRNGLDVGIFLSNGVDKILRYGSNIGAWSVPAFPTCGAGALNSIETSAGIYSLMLASPTGGVTIATPLQNPTTGADIAGAGTAWVNPSNITLGSPASYATATLAAPGSSHTLRASYTVLLTRQPTGVTNVIPSTAIVQGIQVSITGKQTDISGALTLTITPTGGGVSAETHTFQFGAANTTVTFGGSTDTWNMPWTIPNVLATGTLGFDLVAKFTGNTSQTISVAEVQVIITYQNPGNYLYARDVNSFGDGGGFGLNNGSAYPVCNITLGSITLSQLGAELMPLQHIVGYFDAVGTLNNGGPSQPNVWILPNEIVGTGSGTAAAGAQTAQWIQLPEILPEPPIGQNFPSNTLLALRFPVNMMNSYLASQYMAHLQVKIDFSPENASNTIKALSFKSEQT